MILLYFLALVNFFQNIKTILKTQAFKGMFYITNKECFFLSISRNVQKKYFWRASFSPVLNVDSWGLCRVC